MPDLAPRLRHPDVVGAAVTAAIAILVAVTSLRLWDWRPGVPLSLAGDSPLVLSQLRDILDNGWFWSNDSVGFPLGQNASFYPELNTVHILAVKALGAFSADPATVGAVYFVLGYPLAALTAYLLARSQQLTRPAAVTIGVLFAAAPGHAERFEHLWLASYWTIPAAVWVVIEVARGTTPWDERSTPHKRSGRRQALMLVALAVVGSSGVYYAAFILILLGTACALRAGAGRSPTWWRAGLVTMAWTGLFAALPLVASRVGMAGESLTGPRPATRNPLESERYAGRLIDLALPWEGHRLEPLAALTTAYRTAGRPVTETLALGLIGVAGCAALVILALRFLTTGRDMPERLRVWSALLLVSFAFYTVGGMGSVVALVATPQIRTWSRLSILILLLGLLAVGHWLSRRRPPWAARMLAVVVLAVGVLDQTNMHRAPNFPQLEQQVSDTSEYATALLAATGPGCGVLQLPVLSFPEGNVPIGYEARSQLVQHLYSAGLRWSHGGMRGTQAGDWAFGIDVNDPRRLLSQMRAAGFCAIEVDTEGVAATAPAVVSLTQGLGAPVARTPDGRLVAWDLEPASSGGDDDRQRLLEPVIVGLNAGPIVVEDGSTHQDTGPRAALVFSNLGPAEVGPIQVSMDVTAIGASERQVTVVDEGETVAAVTAVEGTPTRLDLTYSAPSGFSRLEIRVSGEPVRTTADRSVSARLADLTVSTAGTPHVVSLHDQAASMLVVP